MLHLFLYCFVFKWHINLWGLSITKVVLVEEQQWCHLIHRWWYKNVNSFTKGIIPKANVIVRQGFELPYFEAAVSHVNCYATGTLVPSTRRFASKLEHFLWSIYCHQLPMTRISQVSALRLFLTTSLKKSYLALSWISLSLSLSLSLSIYIYIWKK